MLALAAFGWLACADENWLHLTYLDRFAIKSSGQGLTEPSGLALSRGKRSLWTVSDDTRKIFRMDLAGDLDQADSFRIDHKGLEGITLDPSGEFLWAVKEEGNQILKIDVGDRETVEMQPLSGLAGYGAVSGFFEGGDPNKGLEGIAWNDDTDTLFVVKEGEPGLIIELSPDARRILGHRVLNAENGFTRPGLEDAPIDFSGLCYDRRHKVFWIVSDQAQRLFRYDWAANRVVQSMALSYGHKGRYREVIKAEGVAVDPDARRLYVVSDAEARLYVFDLRP